MFPRRLLSSFSVARIHHQARMLSLQSTVALSNGQRMPIVGLGTFLVDDEKSIESTLVTAIDLGYRHIDSAFTHSSEKFLGKVLQKLFESGKIKREELFITTKLPMNGLRPDAVEHFMKRSLESLKLNYVDLYLISSPIATKRTTKDEEIIPLVDGQVQMDHDIKLMDTWRVMESLVENNLTKSIGLSNFNSRQIQKIYDAAAIKPTNLQVECHAYLPQYELFEFCQELGIAMTAYAPLGSPAFPEFARSNIGVKDYEKPKLLDDAKLKSVAEKYERTPAQILLKYLVQRGIAVIPKSTNPERLKENVEIFDFSLEDEDLEELKSMANGTRFFPLNFWKGFEEHPEFPFKIPY